jgi:hypothetical protein
MRSRLLNNANFDPKCAPYGPPEALTPQGPGVHCDECTAWKNLATPLRAEAPLVGGSGGPENVLNQRQNTLPWNAAPEIVAVWGVREV